MAIKNTLIAVLSIAVWLSVFEWASFFWINKYGSPYDKALRVLQADSHLGWRQKFHQDTSFMDLPLKTNELGFRDGELEVFKRAEKRILVLGPSSSFGWGVERAQTYSEYLENFLSAETGKKVSVFNAGQIGFSSHQGRLLYESGLFDSAKPDAVVVAYGVNDFDRFRFFFDSAKEDKYELSQLEDKNKIARRNFIFQWAFPQILQKALGELGRFSGCPQKPFTPLNRVALKDIIENFEAIRQRAVSHASRFIVLDTAFDFSKPGEVLEISESKNFDADLNIAREHYDSQRYKESIGRLEKMREDYGNDSRIFYALSAVYAHEGNCRQAQEMFSQARQSEPTRLTRELTDFNHQLKIWAEHNQTGFIGAQALLKTRPTQEMFVDPVHPSAMGHELIASELRKVILNDFTKEK